MNRNSLYAVIFLLSSFQLFSQYAKENAQDLAFYLEDKHPVFTIGTDWTENLQGGKSISVGYIIEDLNSTVDINYVFYNFDNIFNCNTQITCIYISSFALLLIFYLC